MVRTLVRKNRQERFLTSALFADDPKGGGQDARNNPSFSAIYIDVASINLDNASRVKNHTLAPVAQLDRVLGYEPSGRRFESFQARHTIKKPRI